MSLPRSDGWAMPFDAPFYPPLPAWYRNVAFQQVFFRADPAQTARFLPEPLVPSPDGECLAVGIRIPFSTAYGAFNEAALDIRALLDGRPGWYSTHVWHDGPKGIAAGREIYGTPKILSDIEIRMLDASMLTRASIGGVPIITISTTMEQPITAADLRDTSPAWRLKLIPRADRPAPAIKQLIDASSATTDLDLHVAYGGRGTVAFQPSPQGDFTALAPIEYLGAYYFEASYSEGYGTIVLDYLAGDR
jgi:acetoacetate decarboxylase